VSDPSEGTRAGFAGWLTDVGSERLAARLDAALSRARRTGEPTLAAVTEQMDSPVDPASAVLLADRGDRDWGVLDQPDAERASIAVLGCAVDLSAAGEDRFSTAGAKWRELIRGAVVDEPETKSGVGPIAFGGFSFAPNVAEVGPWRGFGSCSMVVPELALVRRGETTWVTAQCVVAPDDITDEILSRLERVFSALEPLGRLEDRTVMVDSEAVRISSALTPQHYESAVNIAVEAIREGRLTKAVLAREVLVERETPHDPAEVMSVLREVFPSCYLYAVGRGSGTFIGASPELLVKREGLRASTVALAGSAPRSADPAVDSHIGERLLRSTKDRSEQEVVTDRIRQALDPVSVWVTASSEPALVKVANIQHLGTPIRAQLRASVGVLDLLGRLHPTPAVGGEPWAEARELISAVEGLDRGWYAAPIGWTDASEDGEFCVALRGALLRGTEARCYAGVGVVEGSDPASELAETELKLQAILPIVSA